MLFKIIIVSPLILLAAESGYILMLRRPSDRFKVLNDYGYGIVAFTLLIPHFVCYLVKTASQCRAVNSSHGSAMDKFHAAL